MAPEMRRCACGEAHEVVLFWQGVPLMQCPKTPPDEMFMLNLDYVRCWPTEIPKEA